MSNKKTAMKTLVIHVELHRHPVPSRRYDYVAFIPDEVEEGAIGWGETPAAALAELAAVMAWEEE
jgi:L-alanine-DL-glutamate epimerase-like enolase superfamily enzyme